MIKCIETLMSLGYDKESSNKIVNTYPLYTYTDETLATKIKNIFLFFLDFGYTTKEVIKMTISYPEIFNLSKENINNKINYMLLIGYTKKDVIKMSTISSLYSLSSENINNKLNFMIILGYTREEVIKMTKILPALYSYSEENISNKIYYIISLGYTKEEVLMMTKQVPALFCYSEDNIKDKIDYLRKIDLGAIIIDAKYLIQSVRLTYARYEYLKKEKDIAITNKNYYKLFIGAKRFERQFGIDKKTLLEKYRYEKEEKVIK